MKKSMRHITNSAWFALLTVFGAGVAGLATASEPQSAASKPVPCGILKEFEGDVQIFDSSRNELIDTDVNASIPCGAWVTVRSGWALATHRQGYVAKISDHTFVQFFDREPKIFTGEDQIVLYRGQIFVRVAQGSEPLRIVTPNARVSVDRGVAVALYHPDEEESQLLALENTATLANRFEPQASQMIKAGEITSLNFKRLRITPSTPRAVTMASLKESLQSLPLDKHEKKLALQAVLTRSARKIPANLKDAAPTEDSQPERKLASAIDPKTTPKPHRKSDWKITKLAGGVPGAADILYPGLRRSKNLDPRYRIQDPSDEILAKEHKAELAEKTRILEELGKLRE